MEIGDFIKLKLISISKLLVSLIPIEHSPLSGVEVTNEWMYGSIIPLILISSCLQQRNLIRNSQYEHYDYNQDSYT